MALAPENCMGLSCACLPIGEEGCVVALEDRLD